MGTKRLKNRPMEKFLQPKMSKEDNNRLMMVHFTSYDTAYPDSGGIPIFREITIMSLLRDILKISDLDIIAAIPMPYRADEIVGKYRKEYIIPFIGEIRVHNYTL